MSKRLDERAVGKKKTVTKSVKVKTKVKANVVAKTTATAKKSVKPLKMKNVHVKTTPARTGFMWKILEQKQKALEQNQGPYKHPFAHANASGTASSPGQKGHGRFNGPRRRAA